MSDTKLFQISQTGVKELTGQSMAVEKKLQTLIESHLDEFLGIRFLASEYTTGKTHGGRIDTLGLDENSCAVIIEYKRSVNESVINQGLYYLDWLLDHKAEYTQLVAKQFGQSEADKVDWGAPRLVCIAGDFTKFDTYAVNQIDRNIELLRYKLYGDELLLLDLVNAKTAKTSVAAQSTTKATTGSQAPTSQIISDLFDDLKATLVGFGDDVQMNTLRTYVAFKRLKNFACVEAQPSAGQLIIYAKVNPDTIVLENGFTQDVRNIGHHGTGDLRIFIKSPSDISKASPLLQKSYDAS